MIIPYLVIFFKHKNNEWHKIKERVIGSSYSKFQNMH